METPGLSALDVYCITITALTVFGLAMLGFRELLNAKGIGERAMLMAGLFAGLGLPAIRAFVIMAP